MGARVDGGPPRRSHRAAAGAGVASIPSSTSIPSGRCCCRCSRCSAPGSCSGWAKPVPVNVEPARQPAAGFHAGGRGRPGQQYRARGGRQRSCSVRSAVMSARHHLGTRGLLRRRRSTSCWPSSTCCRCRRSTAATCSPGCCRSGFARDPDPAPVRLHHPDRPDLLRRAQHHRDARRAFSIEGC